MLVAGNPLKAWRPDLVDFRLLGRICRVHAASKVVEHAWGGGGGCGEEKRVASMLTSCLEFLHFCMLWVPCTQDQDVE